MGPCRSSVSRSSVTTNKMTEKVLNIAKKHLEELYNACLLLSTITENPLSYEGRPISEPPKRCKSLDESEKLEQYYLGAIREYLRFIHIRKSLSEEGFIEAIGNYCKSKKFSLNKYKTGTAIEFGFLEDWLEVQGVPFGLPRHALVSLIQSYHLPGRVLFKYSFGKSITTEDILYRCAAFSYYRFCVNSDKYIGYRTRYDELDTQIHHIMENCEDNKYHELISEHSGLGIKLMIGASVVMDAIQSITNIHNFLEAFINSMFYDFGERNPEVKSKIDDEIKNTKKNFVKKINNIIKIINPINPSVQNVAKKTHRSFFKAKDFRNRIVHSKYEGRIDLYNKKLHEWKNIVSETFDSYLSLALELWGIVKKTDKKPDYLPGDLNRDAMLYFAKQFFKEVEH